ncbi:hypothetical protein M0R88_05380 [Halorussus gelatinilyticus]|uniref:DUF8132 domain-containing protein n=1 Tax=Halorussus gelatinilyticus TaxID=2937524 RepID=A0A8U0ILH7_9EURY|nr:hypothetical protein [Halorussus gelatinilyticus]UPW01536.1 hypothetical protein M0R88_05380 [Halorussus gelatinilyticus]
MRKLLGGATALFGLVVALLGGWMLVRGPFLGGPALEAMPMLAALTAFLVGVVIFFRGVVRWAGVGARI